jgi:hypothetical protein
LALLAVVGSASAYIDLYLASNGISYAPWQTDQAVRNFYRYFQHPATPVAPGCIDSSGFTAPWSSTFYVWGKFVNEPVFTAGDPDNGIPDLPAGQIYGVQLGVGLGNTTAPPCPQPAVLNMTMSASAMYRHSKGNFPAWTRWQTATPSPINDPMATTDINGGMGILNQAGWVTGNTGTGDISYADGDGNINFLLGAFKVESTTQPMGSIKLALGRQGLYMHMFYLTPDPDNPGSFLVAAHTFLPEVYVNAADGVRYLLQDYVAPTDIPPGLPTLHDPAPYVEYYPEPASALLLGLASLLLRRR